MGRKKRFISWILTVAMAVMMAPATGYAQEASSEWQQERLAEVAAGDQQEDPSTTVEMGEQESLACEVGAEGDALIYDGMTVEDEEQENLAETAGAGQQEDLSETMETEEQERLAEVAAVGQEDPEEVEEPDVVGTGVYCNTKKEAYAAIRDMVRRRYNANDASPGNNLESHHIYGHIYVKSDLFDGSIMLEDIYDFYKERNGIMP
nr:hypothetical protein [Lachnospiraceae bacterium]